MTYTITDDNYLQSNNDFFVAFELFKPYLNKEVTIKIIQDGITEKVDGLVELMDGYFSINKLNLEHHLYNHNGDFELIVE